MARKFIAAAAVAAAVAAGVAACSSGTTAAAPAAPPATGAASGPFQLSITACAAGSSATVEVSNVSNSVTATPDVEVKFTDGSTVLGANVNEMGAVGALSPGQSETVTVNNVDPSTAGATGCQGSQYWAVSADGTSLGPYAWG